MGNRATVIFTDGKANFSPAVYLHWNGGPESIYNFLAELDRRDVRADQDYECARFCQLVGEFFDQDEQGAHSLGITNGPRNPTIEALERVQTDHGDNGFYLVNRTGAEMIVRRFTERKIGRDDWRLVEWSAAEVADERNTAAKSDYGEAFREFFAKLAKKTKPRAKRTPKPVAQAVAA